MNQDSYLVKYEKNLLVKKSVRDQNLPPRSLYTVFCIYPLDLYKCRALLREIYMYGTKGCSKKTGTGS